MTIKTMAQFVDKMEYEGGLFDMALYIGKLSEDFENTDFRDTFNSFSHLSQDLNDMLEDWYADNPQDEE